MTTGQGPLLIGEQATERLWYRGMRVYGGRESPILVRLYWPMSDPEPTHGWWV